MSQELPIAEAVVIEPGDTLIVRVDTRTDVEKAERVRNILKERLPLLADVVVIGCEQLTVARPHRLEVAQRCPIAGLRGEEAE